MTNLTNYMMARSEAMAHSDRTVNIYEAKAHLSQLVERAASGEEIIIAKAGKPRARLVPLPREKPPVVYGAWRDRVYIADDFDAPLPDDIQHGFDGGSLK